jgi:hypothetical protein
MVMVYCVHQQSLQCTDCCISVGISGGSTWNGYSVLNVHGTAVVQCTYFCTSIEIPGRTTYRMFMVNRVLGRYSSLYSTS